MNVKKSVLPCPISPETQATVQSFHKVYAYGSWDHIHATFIIGYSNNYPILLVIFVNVTVPNLGMKLFICYIYGGVPISTVLCWRVLSAVSGMHWGFRMCLLWIKQLLYYWTQSKDQENPQQTMCHAKAKAASALVWVAKRSVRLRLPSGSAFHWSIHCVCSITHLTKHVRIKSLLRVNTELNVEQHSND